MKILKTKKKNYWKFSSGVLLLSAFNYLNDGCVDANYFPPASCIFNGKNLAHSSARLQITDRIEIEWRTLYHMEMKKKKKKNTGNNED